MNGLDWFLVGIAVLSVVRGIFRGAISQVFSIAGLLAGFWVGTHFYEGVAGRLAATFPKVPSPVLVSFLALFLLTWFCIGTLGYWLSRVLHRSGLGVPDRVLGAGIGGVKALVLAVVTVSILTLVLPPGTPFMRQSLLVPYVQQAGRLLLQAAPPGVQERFQEKAKELDRLWSEPKREPRPQPIKPPPKDRNKTGI